MVKIKILTGSVRPNRFNIQPATWIYNITKERHDMETELLDLKEINLPFLDEPDSPSSGKRTKEHTIKWSAKISEGDGFVFVTPEYNHSVSPVLKNAIDFLFQEWHYKPVSYVSYGTVGGSRAVEHLRSVAAEVHMFDIREQVMFPNYWDHLNEKGEYQFTQAHEELANKMLDALFFWAQDFKAARERLAAKK